MTTATQDASHRHALAADSSHPVQVKCHWNLRFQDDVLEEQYLLHAVRRDRTFSRGTQTTALLIAIFLCLADLRHLPEHAHQLSLARIPLLFFCWAGWMLLTCLPRFGARLPHATALFAFITVAVLCSSQWLCGHYGYLRPYQTLLFIPLFTPFVGGLPWRFAIFPCLLSAVLLIVPEWLYQPDAALRNLHTLYVVLAMMAGLFSGRVHERVARQHVLLSNIFLEQSRHDPLTKLANRRELDTQLPRLLRQALRERAPLAVAMIDVDYFKKYNDRYGHAAGDAALAAVAHAIACQAMPRPNLVARYGGEEFVAIWFKPGADAQTLGEGLRRAVEAMGMEHVLSPHNGKLTISVGITCRTPTLADDARSLLADTDAALYQAKTAGRNRVCLHDNASAPAPKNSKQSAAVAYAPTFIPDTEITREDRAHWNTRRGTLERPQLLGMIIATLLINVALICADLALPSTPASQLLVGVQTFFVIPLLAVCAELTRHEWAQRRSWCLTPLFIFLYGLSICLVAWSAFRQQVDMPYELLLLIVFQNYTVGTQNWRTACLNSWLFTLLYLAIRWYYLPSGALTHTLMPFLLINFWGTVICATHDRLRLDKFLKQEKLKTLALQDALTGLENRQGMENYLAGIYSLETTPHHTLTVAMVDVDHFKNYNDHYGHAAGDAVLAAVGKTIGQFGGRRPYDFCGRYGGEEFILCWHQCDPQQAVVFGERIRAAIEALNIPHEQSPHGRVTVSIGIMQGSILAPGGRKNIASLMELADQMLYQAKVAGRNRVASRIAEPEKPCPASTPDVSPIVMLPGDPLPAGQS